MTNRETTIDKFLRGLIVYQRQRHAAPAGDGVRRQPSIRPFEA
jgi:hypothetical protein